MKRIFISSLVLALSFNGFAQSTAANVVVTPKVRAFAAEIFKNSPNYMSPEILSVMQLHYDQIEIKQAPVTAGENYTPLSKTFFINKYNPDLKKDDVNFNPDTFNPLKYALDFDARTDMVYRVDNTNYIIYVHKRS